LDELDLFLLRFYMDVMYLIFKQSLAEILLCCHLGKVVLHLNGLQVLNHITMTDVLLRDNGEDILKGVLREIEVGGYLEIGDEVADEFGLIEGLRDKLGLLLELSNERLHALDGNEARTVRVELAPDVLELSDQQLKDLETLLFVGVGETVKDNCHEQVEEDDGDD
jgi:hypothetical protein